MEPHSFERVKAEFAQYLSLPEWQWTHVITQTYDNAKTPIYPLLPLHSWRFFNNYLRPRSPENYGWMFAEKGKTGRLHWHGLVRIVKDLFGKPTDDELWQYMFNRYGRCKVEPLREEQNWLGNVTFRTVSNGISRYLTKYVVKDAISDNAVFDFAGNLDGQEADCKRLMDEIRLPAFAYSPE